jgi:PAS domain S-box-containing protein
VDDHEDEHGHVGLRALAELAAVSTGARMGLAALIDPGAETRVAVHGPAPEASLLDLLDGLVHETLPDAAKDPRLAGKPVVCGPPHVRLLAVRAIPDMPGGVIAVFDDRPGDETLDRAAATLEALARHAAIHLSQADQLERARDREFRLERALDASAHVGAWDWEIGPDRVVADERFARMFGVDPAEAAAGVPIERFVGAIHPDDQPAVEREIAEAVRTLGAYEIEYRIVGGDSPRWVLARGQVYGDAQGTAVRFRGAVADITRSRNAEAELARTAAELAESEARFRVLADSMPQMVWSTRPDGFHDYYNARWYEFTGMPSGSTDGEGWNDMFHPDDRDRAWALWRRSLDTGEPYEIEYRLRHHSGAWRWTLGRAMPIRDADGVITRWFGTCTDIDALKRLEAAQGLISQELSHRIKNIFAVVSALIALSARQYPGAAGFAKSLRTRIAALARAHEFVRPHTEVSRPTVGSMTLHAFLEDLFRAYVDDEGAPRVIITGDDAVFDDQAATSVALLFHELATNAAKYGALSQPGGEVTLTTAARGDRFLLQWREAGGPAVSPPTHAGFGSSLATLSVEGQLGGQLTREWAPAGLHVQIDLPATAMSRRRAALKMA